LVKERLEDVLRPDQVAEDLVLLLRGGVYDEDISRLQQQAAELDRRFTYQGGQCFGVSVFAATPETEADVLATNMDVRRRYYRIHASDIADLLVLPTFRSPHWTVKFNGADGPDYGYFVDAWGDLRENPYYSRTPGRRPR
jgi:hypothetical protein